MKHMFKTLLAAAAATTLIAGSAFADGYKNGAPDAADYNSQTGIETEMGTPDASYETDTTVETQASAPAPDASIIRQAQKNLNKEGYSLSVDGVLGPQTEAAIRSFQSDNDLDISGHLDAKTLSELDVANSSY